MKANRILKTLLIILIVVLLSVVSFGGIYYLNKGNMQNVIPNYTMSSSLNGYRQIMLAVDTSEEETEDENNATDENVVANQVSNGVSNDVSGEETNSTNETSDVTNNTSNETNTSNGSSSNNAGKYKESAKIIKNRLKSLNVDNYNISCDANSGRIVLELPEDNKTDIILSDLIEIGKFSIEDSETGEVLLNNDDVKSVRFGEQAAGVNSSSLVMGIEFNTKGARKFKKVTKEYQNNVDENLSNTSDTSNTSVENTTENESSENATSESENATEETNSTNEDSSAESKKDKKVKIKIDQAELLTTDFSEIIDNGMLTLTIGDATDSSQKNAAYNLGAIIENDPLPVKYTIDGNVYIESAVKEKTIKILIYAEIIIALIVVLVLIAKYRLVGILQAILSVGYIAILLIVVRYANVVISLDGILAVLICYLLNSIFSFMISKVLSNKNLSQKDENKELNKVFKKYSLIVIPELIISIICLFTSWSAIFSLGMILFWGIVISLIYNVLITKLIW